MLRDSLNVLIMRTSCSSINQQFVLCYLYVLMFSLSVLPWILFLVLRCELYVGKLELISCSFPILAIDTGAYCLHMPYSHIVSGISESFLHSYCTNVSMNLTDFLCARKLKLAFMAQHLKWWSLSVFSTSVMKKN